MPDPRRRGPVCADGGGRRQEGCRARHENDEDGDGTFTAGPRHSRPLADQNIPKDVRSIPTMNFNVFSGIRLRGRWTRIPTAATTTTVNNAARALSANRCCAAPKVRTMKTTSRPSRKTPLKATVKE